MSRPGVNLAVTRDGETYNKLRRPDDFVAALASQPSPKEEPVPAIPSATGSYKRKLADAEITDAFSDDEPESKKLKEEGVLNASNVTAKPISADPRRVKRPVRDCGMQSMFPGLDDEESSDEATTEALAYLRSVRSEASTIPKLLVAAPELADDEPDRSMYSNGRGDHRAVYNDGTWVAVDPDASRRSDDCWSENLTDLDSQDQNYKSLLRRYEALRSTLAKADPKKLAVLMEANPSGYTDTQLPTNRKAWLATLDRDFPTPARIAHINERNTFCALQYCAETLDRYETISKQKSCWIWTLLALAGEKGTLDYYRAGRIRDLGHKAGQLSVLLHSGARPRPASEDEDEDVEEWYADGDGTEGENEEQNTSDSGLTSTKAVPSRAPPEAEEHDHGEDGEIPELPNSTQSNVQSFTRNGTKGIAAQMDGYDEREAVSDDSADMSMSEDEGEVQEDDEAEVKGGSTGLEEARARLLAQLGDRLIQPSVPPSKGSKQKTQHAEQNGVSSTHLPAKVHASRAEAELQRQKIRKEVLAKAKPKDEFENGGASASSASAPECGAKEDLDTDPQIGAIDLNTRVTIDMILTVVAECYGQRDLLRYREMW